MKKIIALVSALCLFVLMAGCGGTDQKQAQEKTEKSFKAQVTFSGSSTLAPVISTAGKDFTDKYKTWNNVDKSMPEEAIAITAAPGGSGAGVKAVLDKTGDFGMLAREIKASERDQIKDLKEYKLGIDALTIAVNPENPILKIKDNLTKDEIKNIFSGEIKNWNQLDPSLPDAEIVVVIRDLSGGAHEVFQSKIMGETKVREDAIQSPSMGALAAKVMENKNAIGYASFGVVNQNSGKLIPLKVDGVEATKENILAGKYIIARPLICIASGELTASAESFINYLTGEAGKAVIEKLGFIPAE
jgi:phosphate transport system substrate-binding protein